MMASVSVTQTAAPVLHVFVQCVCCNTVCVCVLIQVLCRRVRQVSQSSVVHTLAQRFVAVRGFSAAGSSGSDEPYIAVPSQNSGVKCIL